jgi:phage I-like protein
MAADEIEIAQAGEYWGHWQGGHELTVAELQRMVANFTEPVVIDYEHANQLAEPGREVPAAGWISSVWVDGQSLRGSVSWTDRAEEMIDADEYRFLSPVINPDATDKETDAPIGAVLDTVALTNVPFMEGMESVRNTSGGGGLGRFGARTSEAILNSSNRTISHSDDDASSSSQSDPDTMADDNERSNWERFKSKMKGILNSESSEEVDLLDDARQLSEAQERAEKAEQERDEAQSELEEARERIEELEADLEEDEEEKEEAEAEKDEEILNSAVEQGKIKKADRADWAERMENNRSGTRALLNSIDPGTVVPGAQAGGGPEEPDDAGGGAGTARLGGGRSALRDRIDEQAEQQQQG